MQGSDTVVRSSTAEGRSLSAARSSLELLEASIDTLARANLDAIEAAAVEELTNRITVVRSQLGAVNEPHIKENRE